MVRRYGRDPVLFAVFPKRIRFDHAGIDVDRGKGSAVAQQAAAPQDTPIPSDVLRQTKIDVYGKLAIDTLVSGKVPRVAACSGRVEEGDAAAVITGDAGKFVASCTSRAAAH